MNGAGKEVLQINPDKIWINSYNIVIISSCLDFFFIVVESREKENKNIHANSQRDTSNKAEANKATFTHLITKILIKDHQNIIQAL